VGDGLERIKKEAGCCFLPLVDTEEAVIIPGVGGWPAASIPKKEICKIIQPRMAEIFTLVRDQIVKKDFLRHLGGGVVLTGGGALLPGAAGTRPGRYSAFGADRVSGPDGRAGRGV
jgi:cell division protein FtsA